MSVRWEEEARRLALLARLELAPEEAAALASACEAITREFAALASYAASLPEVEPAPVAAPRSDEASPAPAAEVEAILGAVPRLDAKTRAVVVPRGLP